MVLCCMQTSYRVVSSPEGVTATGAASPVVITGLRNIQKYTFTVVGTIIHVSFPRRFSLLCSAYR